MVTKGEVYEYSYQNRSLEYLKDKLMEEMTELMKEIFKCREKKLKCTPNLIKEFADVSLMMKQLDYYYNKSNNNNDFSNLVDQYEHYKCDKLWAIWHDEPLPEEPF